MAKQRQRHCIAPAAITIAIAAAAVVAAAVAAAAVARGARNVRIVAQQFQRAVQFW
jgi:hypothetical protein